MSYKLESLIAPYTIEEFFQHYYEKEYFYISRHDENYYNGILNTQDIDLFFQNQSLQTSGLRVCNKGGEIPASQWRRGLSQIADNDKLFVLLNQGNTLIINSGNSSIIKLINYCHVLENELNFRLQSNIYITPPDAQGFAYHYDDHDVFIMQTTGTKTWRLYHSPIEIPTKKQNHAKFMKGKYELGEPTFEQEIKPGDLLYIPRGLVHDAVTTDQASVHITLGLHPSYRFELLQEIVNLAQDNLLFRKAIPNPFTPEYQKKAFKAEFKQLCHDFIDNVDIGSLLETKFDNFLASQTSEDQNRFFDSIQVHKLNLNSVLSRRENIVYKLEKDDEEIHVKFYRKTLDFPLFTEFSLQTLLKEDSFAVKDIGGLISENGKIELATKFVREGLLRIEKIND
ncbi:Cupin superfamily protein [Xenococcus sp. PCC 7305]|uniref:cupin domain-containing protein n=1 Tax=Xenococcus sp. PCC 7305 TaxID=102125 RepID=UPI0002AD16FF|nr:cupin domain-containing protein [Xenococcus sp. PCC 7305]ELS02186.1 Cupin superfamily protein [Xenococcus sp. PCC 7305]